MLDFSVQRPKYRKNLPYKVLNICFSSFIIKVGGFVKVPGYEPVHLDLEKLFLLSVSKENLDLSSKNEKNLPYKI